MYINIWYGDFTHTVVDTPIRKSPTDLDEIWYWFYNKKIDRIESGLNGTGIAYTLVVYEINFNIYLPYPHLVHAVAHLVEALRYKSESRGFDSR
jgi:hypothetical protein